MSTHASPIQNAARAQPTLYLAGDSTMALKGANNGKTDGWGNYVADYVTLPVVNKAIGGRSARSYTAEGHFTEILDVVKSGDIVVIEFGHNDGGSPTSTSDNGRSDCPGSGATTYGSTVHTFDYYITTAAKSYTAKNASVIVSSQTPNNLWEGGVYSATAPRFLDLAKTAAANAGKGAYFVDHFSAVAAMYKELGNQATNALYPADHTHTSPAGANLSANAFAEAVQKASNPLTPFIKAKIPTVY
ncbi:hypothetical protein LTS14_004684 [Recurvomyces mirabilis]|uniref:uncharacterized protein n=1 Tax=Recurvomyces mirabilis TaxID=574656 RepID=UPI002DDE891E|nr:hypothetical protein LTS14_004684 [Recurvomyces mirabilis]